MTFYVRPEIADEIVDFMCEHDLGPGDKIYAQVETDGWLVDFFDERQTCGFTAKEVTRYPTLWYLMPVVDFLHEVTAFEPPTMRKVAEEIMEALLPRCEFDVELIRMTGKEIEFSLLNGEWEPSFSAFEEFVVKGTWSLPLRGDDYDIYCDGPEEGEYITHHRFTRA